MNKTKSLKKEILSILIYFSIFISSIVGIISMVNFYYSKLSNVEHNQKQILKQVESEVNKFLKNIYNISDYLQSNYSKDSNLLRNIVDTNNNITSILILNKDGIIKDYYAPTNKNIYKNFDYSKKDYFKNITNEVNFYWSNVFLSSLDNALSFSYSFKANNGNIIVMMLKLNEISNFISNFRNQDSTHMIRILDKNGVMLLNHDKPNLVLQRTSIKNSDVYVSLINKLEPYSFTKFKAFTLSKYQYGTYTNIANTSWKIVVREHYDMILSSLNGIIYGTIISVLLFIFISILISLKISKRLFKSLDNLKETTGNIANGNYDVEVKETYYREFNQLLRSFNKMKIEIDKREDALEESVESFKSLVNVTMEAIVIHKDGICTDVNDIAVRLFAYDSKEDMIGKNYLDFVSTNSKKLVEQNLKIDTEPYEIEFLRKDGTIFMSLGQGRFIELSGDRYKVSTIIDITEVKEKDKLLFQQSKMASMGEMIGNIAHQWRQPLSAISSSASGMKLQKEYGFLRDEEFFDSIDSIVNSTQYLSKTIDDFRNFFKIDKEMKSFSLLNVIDNILSLVGSTYQSHRIDIIINNEKDFKIFGYENELIQALINILNNAKDALILNNSEEKVIFIDLEKVNNSVRIIIKDSGGGISEEILPSIFEPYFTTKYNHQGTGIGLYMTHQIIVLHMKGKIYVENVSFKYNEKIVNGAQFSVDLKISEDNT